ncbi:hypothetical protein [Bacillus atrophaeus]|uniref:hypothetical protein n=1 Tax=Bacillus atrophaeus TaxID=1452 RepID=UPI0022831B8C|nr:hypothetical protein [Bacillus atrophaeus]MCY9166306.1 hypothetical protein [Bacillus atrophaeus]
MANNAAVRIVQHIIEEIDTKVDESVKSVRSTHYRVVGFVEYNQLSAAVVIEVIQQLAYHRKGSFEF